MDTPTRWAWIAGLGAGVAGVLYLLLGDVPAAVGHRLMLDRNTRLLFLGKMKPVTRVLSAATGIPADFIMAQAAHESAWGTSGLTVSANNLFGFTGDSWKAQGKPILELPTTEYVKGVATKVTRPFRRYASWYESVQDWARLISTPRYASALVAAKRGDFEGFAAGLVKGGYATDPKYAQQLGPVHTEVVALLPGAMEVTG